MCWHFTFHFHLLNYYIMTPVTVIALPPPQASEQTFVRIQQVYT